MRFGRSKRRVVPMFLALALGVAAVACFTGCQSTPQTTGGQICTYNEVIHVCTTDAGCKGSQTCLPDLSGYGPCVCESDAGQSEDGDAAPKKDGG
jgi:hypothetical protein